MANLHLILFSTYLLFCLAIKGNFLKNEFTNQNILISIDIEKKSSFLKYMYVVFNQIFLLQSIKIECSGLGITPEAPILF